MSVSTQPIIESICYRFAQLDANSRQEVLERIRKAGGADEYIRKERGNAEFRKKKSLDEIIAEQGGPRVCTNPTRLWEDFPKLWETEAELDEFLERRKY